MSKFKAAKAKSWYLGFVVGFALVQPRAFAEEPPPPEAQTVIANQLEAFERDDAAVAWNLTAPEIREKFHSADDFFGMVKANYGPIYRHRSVDFGPSARRGDEIGIVVTLVGEDNEVWSAVFVLSKQNDGAWKTSACLLAKAPEKSV